MRPDQTTLLPEGAIGPRRTSPPAGASQATGLDASEPPDSIPPRPVSRPRASVPGRSSGGPPRGTVGGTPPGGSGPTQPLTPAAPPPPPPKKRRLLVLGATAVVAIGLVAGLVVFLSNKKGPADEPTPTAATSASKTSSSSKAPTSSAPAPETSAAGAESSSAPAPETSSAPAGPSIDPSVKPYLAYCRTFYEDGPEIRRVSQNIIGFRPPPDFDVENPDQVWAVVENVIDTVGNVLDLIDESLAAGPPPAMYDGLSNARNQFQQLYDAFDAVDPDNDPAYTGKLLTASQLPTQQMQDNLSALVNQVGDQTAAFCPSADLLDQYPQ